MRAFDVLDIHTALAGPHLLEASAGTGKTFAIEHLYVRLLLEGPLDIEQILAITFTKASTREMRMRIRANLGKALKELQEGIELPYLQPHAGSGEAKRRLEEALICFDSAQIFTIHGFCQKMLTEFSLEASFLPGEREEAPFRKTACARLLDFLETQEVLSSEQLGILLSKQRGSFAELVEKILDAPLPLSGGSFQEDVAALKEVFERLPYYPRREEIQEEFERLRPSFKTAEFKGDRFEEQINCLAECNERSFRRLLVRGGSILRFLDPNNCKRGKEVTLGPFFNWCLEHVLPVIEQATDPKRLFERLRFAWQIPFEKLLEEEGLFSPDMLLQRMQQALDREPFVCAIQSKIKAAIIDEFQDTDAVQWKIFHTLFLDKKRPFYLVGDPKQSIYRFRQADLYTYYAARDLLGEEAQYSLDTNYRSTPALVSALNLLFSDEETRPWLLLPKENREEPYLAVKAGLTQEWDPGDGKQALQFFITENLEQEAIAYTVQEIRSLRRHLSHYSSFAVLVKDRHQMSRVQSALIAEGLPVWAKSQQSLGASLACSALEECFDALYFPRDSSRLKIFLAGPFVGLSAEALLEQALYWPSLFQWKELLDREGLPAFFRAFIAEVEPAMRQRGREFYRDVVQIMEQLLEIRVVCLETIKRVFRELESADPDEEVAVRRRLGNEEEAISIMTMHGCKGLEFDVVFALGAAEKTPVAEEEHLESAAEKLRQLYVTLTRAKKRLYIPLLKEAAKVRVGAESPLELFWQRSRFGGEPKAIALRLAASPLSIGVESVSLCPNATSDFSPQDSELLSNQTFPSIPRFAERTIFSYSGLSRKEPSLPLAPLSNENRTLHTLPRGTDTGLILHQIFERIFTEEREPARIVADELRVSSLSEWEEPIQALVKQVLLLPLFEGVTEKRAEVEFLFAREPHFLKGFIDLVFLCRGQLYFLDWKTNWLGASDKDYAEEHLKRAMTEGDYWLQASLYRAALERAWSDLPFGGAYYLFLRGLGAVGQGVLFFQPSTLDIPL